MKKLISNHTPFYLVALLLSLATVFANQLLTHQEQNVERAYADSVGVDCSGSSAAPTAVTEADLSGDDVTFNDAGGDGWCILDEPISAASVIVSTGVTLTHTATDTDGVNITTSGNFTIQSGAYINADEKGCFLTGNGDGWGPDLTDSANNYPCVYQGAGSGNGALNIIGAGGGGYGGGGGLGTGPYGHGDPGDPYGNSTAPAFLGASGGGAGGGSYGGSGGGKVVLDIGGTFSNSGIVSANGGSVVLGDTSHSGAGGSGGSIYITASTISSDSGNYSAEGGNGYVGNGTTNVGGGGGGGRVAIVYDADSSNPIQFPTAARFQLGGGSAGASGGVAQDGDAGTVYLLDKNGTAGTTTDDSVEIFSGFTYDDTDYNVNYWVINDNADNQYCASGTTTPSVTAAGNILFAGTLDCAEEVTSFNWSAGDTMQLYGNSSMTVNGPLNLSGTTAFYMQSNTSVEVQGMGNDLDFNIPDGDDQTGSKKWDSVTITVPLEGQFTIDDAIDLDLYGTTTINGSVMWTNMGDVTIGSSASINANEKGCHGRAGSSGYGPNASNVCTSDTAGAGAGALTVGADGAGYGGIGGTGSSNRGGDNVGGSTYGSASSPVYFGSSGGGAHVDGGAGGGLIRIVSSGTLTHNGTLSVDAGTPTPNPSYTTGAGGGSGGSIYLSADTYTNSTGTFSAEGGAGQPNDSYDGGGGGGGRIAVAYSTDTNSTLSGLSASSIAAGGAAGDVATSDPGANGTFATLVVPSYSNFPTSAGTTNFNAVDDINAVADMKLANSSGSVLWDGTTVNANGEDYDSYVKIGSGFVSMDVSNVDDTLSNDSDTVSGFSATVSIQVAGCTSFSIYHADGFHSSLSSIKGDASVETCNTDTTSTCAYVSNIDCTGTTLSFDVTHFDGYGGEGSTSADVATTTGVDNTSPVFITTPSDGGSDATSPANEGEDTISFTGTAVDINDDQYYLAICKVNGVTAGDDTYPTCDGGSWMDSNPTPANSGDQASASYAVTGSETCDESCDWYAFVCDKVSGGGLCMPLITYANPGVAVGTIAFADVPDDGDYITVDSVVYEFDTGDDGITGGRTEVDTSASQDGYDTGVALAAVETGANSHMVVRGAVVYVYANVAGAGGNSIGMTENQDTSNLISLSGTSLDNGAGGPVTDAQASPFKVNHRPSIGTVNIGDTTGGTGSVEPGEDVYFNVAVTDSDTDTLADTIDMHVCLTDSFTEGSGCDANQTICYTTGNSTGGNAECDSGDLSGDLLSTYNPSSTTSGTKTVYVFLEDSHDFMDAQTDNTQTYEVTNTAPTVISVTLTDTMDPAAGGSDTITWTAVINDDNGEGDITGVTGYLYDDAAIDLSSGTCTETEADCYKDADDCSINTTYGTSTQVEVTCSVVIWFNANASIGWKAHVNPSDSSTTTTDGSDSSAIENPALQGIDVAQASISYSTVVIGGTSDRQETSIGNVGNVEIDIQLDGTAMSCSSGNCGSNTIAASQQKWYHVDEAWDWNAITSAAGPYTLQTSASGTDDETGCLNRSIEVRSAHANTTETNESIWWKIRIPDTQAAGSYTGSNTFTSTPSTTCSEGQAY